MTIDPEAIIMILVLLKAIIEIISKWWPNDEISVYYCVWMKW